MSWARKILRVDLSKGTCTAEPLNMDWAKVYLGQRGHATKYFTAEVDPKVDPLSPANKLSWATGPLTGTMASTGVALLRHHQGPAHGRHRLLELGRLLRRRAQDGRLDAGFAAGVAVPPHYDSMIAKLIVTGPTAPPRSPSCARRWPTRSCSASPATCRCCAPSPTTPTSRPAHSTPTSSTAGSTR